MRRLFVSFFAAVSLLSLGAAFAAEPKAPKMISAITSALTKPPRPMSPSWSHDAASKRG